MTTLTPSTRGLAPDETSTHVPDLGRASAWFGIAYTVCQLAVMVVMTTVVLPHGGGPSESHLLRGQGVLDAENLYRWGNFVFMLSGSLLLGFLGAVHLRLRRADASGVLAPIGLAAGALLALIWPMGGFLHDVALEAAAGGVDPRILGGWDSVAPYSLAFSVLPRLFFVGAIVLGLRLAGEAPWLQRLGVVILPVSLVGCAVTTTEAVFPLLALSTLAFELWVGAVAWHWLRSPRA